MQPSNVGWANEKPHSAHRGVLCDGTCESSLLLRELAVIIIVICRVGTSRLRIVLQATYGCSAELQRQKSGQSAAVRVTVRLTCNICCAVTLWREQFRFPPAVLPNLAYPHSPLEAQVAAILAVEALHLATARHMYMEGVRQLQRVKLPACCT